MLLSSSWLLDILIVCIILLWLSYKYFTRNFEYWKKRGIRYPKPVPFFGNFYDVATFKTTTYELLKKLYDEENEPYFGIFIFDEPVLVLKSPKLIKDILTKDFNSFSHRSVAAPDHNNVISNFLFIQRNPAWKQTRMKLTPLFSTGMVKSFFSVLKEISKDLTDHLEHNSVIDAKEVAGNFSIEIIARCFYGVNPYCFGNEKSTFRKYVDTIFEFTFRNAGVQILYFLKPNWVNFLKLDLIQKDTVEYFDSVYNDAMTTRAGYKGKIKNLIDIMNDAENSNDGDSKKIDLDVVKSNALLFMIAGQETTSSLIAYSLYELALNQNAQDKLRNEIQSKFESVHKITCEGLRELKYLEMCINETMRKYTALPFLDRVAVSDYRIENTNVIIEKGTKVFIPYFAIQRDQKYFKNPDKFDPDRFFENNYNEDGLTFFPFGEGPRACIGKRLGMLSVEIALANVLLKFKLEKCENTPDPVEFQTKSLVLHSKSGLPIKLVPL